MTTATTTTPLVTTVNTLVFTTYGIPQSQGSKRAVCARKNGVLTGFAYVVDAADWNKKQALAKWRTRVKDAAIAAAKAAGWTTADEPISLTLRFMLPRPQRPQFGSPAVMPDASKLARAVEDSLTDAAIYKDDARIVNLHVHKQYAETDCGVEITVSRSL